MTNTNTNKNATTSKTEEKVQPKKSASKKVTPVKAVIQTTSTPEMRMAEVVAQSDAKAKAKAALEARKAKMNPPAKVVDLTKMTAEERAEWEKSTKADSKAKAKAERKAERDAKKAARKEERAKAKAERKAEREARKAERAKIRAEKKVAKMMKGGNKFKKTFEVRKVDANGNSALLTLKVRDALRCADGHFDVIIRRSEFRKLTVTLASLGCDLSKTVVYLDGAKCEFRAKDKKQGEVVLSLVDTKERYSVKVEFAKPEEVKDIAQKHLTDLADAEKALHEAEKKVAEVHTAQLAMKDAPKTEAKPAPKTATKVEAKGAKVKPEAKSAKTEKKSAK